MLSSIFVTESFVCFSCTDSLYHSVNCQVLLLFHNLLILHCRKERKIVFATTTGRPICFAQMRKLWKTHPRLYRIQSRQIVGGHQTMQCRDILRGSLIFMASCGIFAWVISRLYTEGNLLLILGDNKK